TDEDFMDLASKLLEEQIGGEQLSLVLDKERVDEVEREGKTATKSDETTDTNDTNDVKAEPANEPPT
ncbi:MAG TPA: hypothetical protein VLB44_13525, partial [Kofleriaceae bacterium]|nr:hypothetical protein [Kofleriaceae bacterium]